MVVGFALIFYSLGSPFNDAAQRPGFRSDLYVSGTTIFTLGLGDVTPHSAWARELVILEAGTGLGFLAVVMGYFPGPLHCILASRSQHLPAGCAGRFSANGRGADAPPFLSKARDRRSRCCWSEWERWSAELLESHISYPLLCYFRSQHNNQSWISALTAILDTSALLIAGVRGHEARRPS